MAAGIHFTEDSDHLVWEDNPLQGSVSAKLAYNILMEDIGDNVVTGLRRILWSDKLPLKISCFIWLCMENKILTWQNYKAVVSVVPGCVIYVIAHLKISIIYSGWAVSFFRGCGVWSEIDGHVFQYGIVLDINEELLKLELVETVFRIFLHFVVNQILFCRILNSYIIVTSINNNIKLCSVLYTPYNLFWYQSAGVQPLLIWAEAEPPFVMSCGERVL